jgi:hypothetical protein
MSKIVIKTARTLPIRSGCAASTKSNVILINAQWRECKADAK